MNLLARWISAFGKQARPGIPAEAFALSPVPASLLDDLTEKLDRWEHLWSSGKEIHEPSQAQRLVAERLTQWMERCFGKQMPTSLRGNGDPISLASSMPILTAFLGRRATRELSRRILRDI